MPTATNKMTHFLDLCNELLHAILVEALPADLASLSRTCRTLNEYMKGNRMLWRGVYVHHFDEPPCQDDFDWELELKKLVSFQKIMTSGNVADKRSSLDTATQIAIDLLHNASKNPGKSLNVPFLADFFEATDNRNVFLFSSGLYGYNRDGTKRAGSGDQRAALTDVGRQASAKLHSYYGTSKEAIGRTRSKAAHPFARSKVYDLRNYTDHNLWGPFQDDGSLNTDWEKIESIMIVLGFNLQAFTDRCDYSGHMHILWDKPFFGVTPNSYEPMPKCPILTRVDKAHSMSQGEMALMNQPDLPLDARDPYGVTGTWRRVVCFLDYNDLYAFNFISEPPPDGVPRDPLTKQEAIRLITMKIQVTKFEEPHEHDGKELPVVHFKGISRSMHASWDPNANSKLRGTVRLTPEGEVRWTTLSIFHGEARWRSESIQIGGLRSARGVIGTWFDKDYDLNGPAGPTAFWKLTDDVEGQGAEEEWGSGLPMIG